MSRLGAQWWEACVTEIRRPEVAEKLKAAALSRRLRDWTTQLTSAVVASCRAVGWEAAAKGFPMARLGQPGQEYLGLDVFAFEAGRLDGVHWPPPVAVFELENSTRDKRVAYSLWKALCVATELRVVFAYRPSWESGRALVSGAGESVVGSFSIPERSRLRGETLLVVGSRGEGGTFPYGYFKVWALDANTGRFRRLGHG